MAMRLLDTNIVSYLMNNHTLATAYQPHLTGFEWGISFQTLGELHRVLVGKAGRAPAQARTAILNWADAFDVADSTADALRAALDLATDHQMQIWDALILSVAADQKCRLLLSEDFQHEFTWRGVTVLNPFRNPQHTLLASILL